MTDIKKVTSLGEYIDVIDELYRPDKNAGLWFRGHSNKNNKLMPSVYRSKNAKCSAGKLYDDFYKRAGLLLENAPPRENTAFWLTKAQHYGLPTKLLDWSNSPLVALYFALKNERKFDVDGCVWVLNATELNSDQIRIDSAINVGQISFEEYLNPPNENEIKACWPVNNDSRVVAQQSRFTFHNYAGPMEEAEMFKKFLTTQIIILKEHKQKLKDQLANCGIKEHSIFPDMERIAEYLKKIRNFE